MNAIKELFLDDRKGNNKFTKNSLFNIKILRFKQF